MARCCRPGRRGVVSEMIDMTGDPQQQIQARFEGRVQGVGFRFTTVDLAAGLNVTGFVKNLPDGSVELVAEGPSADLHRLLQRIEGSHLGKLITDRTVVETGATGTYRRFGIAY